MMMGEEDPRQPTPVSLDAERIAGTSQAGRSRTPPGRPERPPGTRSSSSAPAVAGVRTASLVSSVPCLPGSSSHPPSSPAWLSRRSRPSPSRPPVGRGRSAGDDLDRGEPTGHRLRFKLEFNKPPWGEDCKTRCANATLFLDTDNNKTTGLKLADPKAAETGTDIAVTIQGAKALKEGVATSVLRVKVIQYSETPPRRRGPQPRRARSDQRLGAGARRRHLGLPAHRREHGRAAGRKQLRIIYHPPESKPLIGMANGIASPPAGGWSSSRTASSPTLAEEEEVGLREALNSFAVSVDIGSGHMIGDETRLR